MDAVDYVIIHLAEGVAQMGDAVWEPSGDCDWFRDLDIVTFSFS